MVDETLPPPAAPGPPDRRRPAPTIELEATEIASEVPRETVSRPGLSESSAASGGPEHMPPDQDTASASRPGMALRWPLLGGAVLGVAATLAGGAVALW